MHGTKLGWDLTKTRLFKGLTAAECAEVCRTVSPVMKDYERNAVIVRQGDYVTRIGLVKSGKPISIKYHYDGGSQVLRVFRAGDVFGLEAASSRLMTSPVALLAAEYCTLILFPYKELMSNNNLNTEIRGKIMENVLNEFADENIRLTYKIDVLSKRKLRDRIMTHLCIISEKRQSASFELGMNQEQFAQYLCVDRSTLSSELNKMREEGLISYRRSRYTINQQINS